jgi:peptidoglycan/LPS O-acetylase OafA/YrhL
MKKSITGFLEQFRRITSGGSYIAEIDGLRFIAIFWVVVWLHLPDVINQYFFQNRLFQGGYTRSVIMEGGQGVAFFFIISGFILSLPFIRENLYKSQHVSLKKYYLRRLTRLEPPYLAALLIAYMSFTLVKRISFSEELPHLGASAIYLQGIIYHSASDFLGIAWSLEVEVQFYLLVPLLCSVFLIRNKIFRRSLLAALTLSSAMLAYDHLWSQPVILPWMICYFFAGMLLADLYAEPGKKVFTQKILLLPGIALILSIPFIPSFTSLGSFLFKLLLMFGAFYMVLFFEPVKKFMSRQWITLIGGMCYSIYLMHTMILSAMAKILSGLPSLDTAAGFIFYAVVMILAVLAGSALFYRLIEQPCMRKDWWKNILIRKRSA